jgi:hypothetical protein
MVPPGATVTPPSPFVSDNPVTGTQAAEPTVLLSIVTAPVCTSALPDKVAFVCKSI